MQWRWLRHVSVKAVAVAGIGECQCGGCGGGWQLRVWMLMRWLATEIVEAVAVAVNCECGD